MVALPLASRCHPRTRNACARATNAQRQRTMCATLGTRLIKNFTLPFIFARLCPHSPLFAHLCPSHATLLSRPTNISRTATSSLRFRRCTQPRWSSCCTPCVWPSWPSLSPWASTSPALFVVLEGAAGASRAAARCAPATCGQPRAMPVLRGALGQSLGSLEDMGGF